MNASDARGKKALEQSIGDVLGTRVLNFKGAKGNEVKRVLIMDEVDGMGAGDRSGMSELIRMIKVSKIPIICICNDRQSTKIRSLVNHCLDLKFSRPNKAAIGTRAVEIGNAENMDVEPNAAQALAESCGNDIRQVLNALQMWATKAKGKGSDGKRISLKYMEYKERAQEIGKDEMLRVSMFDAGRLIMEGRRGLRKESSEEDQRKSFFKRNDAFFTDYALMGLLVHQNYPKVLSNQFNQAKTTELKQQVVSRLSDATKTMSDYGLVEHMVRGGDQHWELLPTAGETAAERKGKAEKHNCEDALRTWIRHSMRGLCIAFHSCF